MKFDVLVSGGMSSRIEAMDAAEATWPAVAEHIVLLKEDRPTVKRLLGLAIDRCPLGGTICLVNRDIHLLPIVARVGWVAERENLGPRWAATSFRHETEDGKMLGVIGQGLDIFVMPALVAGQVFHAIPNAFTTGRILWDNWLNGYLAHILPPGRYLDLTEWAGVIHPKHVSAAHGTPFTPEAQAEADAALAAIPGAGLPGTRFPAYP